MEKPNYKRLGTLLLQLCEYCKHNHHNINIENIKNDAEMLDWAAFALSHLLEIHGSGIVYDADNGNTDQYDVIIPDKISQIKKVCTLNAETFGQYIEDLSTLRNNIVK